MTMDLQDQGAPLARAATAVEERPPPAPAPEPPPAAAPARTAAVSRADAPTVVRRGLALFAVLVAAFAAFLFGLSAFQAASTQSQRQGQLKLALAEMRAPIGGAIAPGTPVAKLVVPALGLDAAVVEGTTSQLTFGGPGHVRATPLPGQLGNSVVMARRTSFGGPFRDLGALAPGDRISVATGQGHSVYRVTEVGTTGADDKSLFETKGSGGRLTLVTSNPPVLASGYSFAQARLVTKPKSSTPHLRELPKSELGLAGEHGTLLPLIFALQVLLAAAIGATWLFLRWRRWPAYIVATPVLVALCWIVFEQVTRLLPATL